MRTALLVDYGGVLTTSVLESFVAFCEDEEIDVEVFRRAVLGAARGPDSPFARVEVGAIDAVAFDAEVASLLSDACGRAVRAESLKQRMFARVRPDPAMVGAVRAARAAGIRTALVSNSWGGGDYPDEIRAGLFDALVISGEVGMRKPDADIYLHAAARAGVGAGECVFVDDLRVNVEGAEAVGMLGILHRSAAATLPLLEDALNVSLRG